MYGIQIVHAFLSQDEETVSPLVRLQSVTASLATFGRLIHRVKPQRNEADSVANYIFMLVLFSLVHYMKLD
jgi:hypothetical protein